MPHPRSQYSIDQAPDPLAQLVDQAEQGAIELVRQGKPVAVILSAADYNRLVPPPQDFWTSLVKFRQQLADENIEIDPDEVFKDVPPQDFWTSLVKFRQQLADENIEIDPDEVFKDVRDRSPGRDIIL